MAGQAGSASRSSSRTGPALAAQSASKQSQASPPDGYTLLLISSSAPISVSYYKKLNFDLIRDIAAVWRHRIRADGDGRAPFSARQNGPEFIAYAKANPGKINMASVGNGTTPQMAGELFKLMAGVDLLHVPYRGAAPALTDLLGGRAQVMFESVTTLVSYIQAGKLRALAVTTPKRSPLLPDVPAIARIPAGLRRQYLVRHRRPETNACRYRRSAQQGDQRRAE